MSKDLLKAAKDLENFIDIQRLSATDSYMRGMLNGMIFAHSVMAKVNPSYIKKISKVRHKSK